MKNLLSTIRYSFALLCIYCLATTNAFAQQALTDTLPSSAYQVDVPKRVINVYSDFVPYVLFGIVGALILYVSFRYWNDNRPHNHINPQH